MPQINIRQRLPIQPSIDDAGVAEFILWSNEKISGIFAAKVNEYIDIPGSQALNIKTKINDYLVHLRPDIQNERRKNIATVYLSFCSVAIEPGIKLNMMQQIIDAIPACAEGLDNRFRGIVAAQYIARNMHDVLILVRRDIVEVEARRWLHENSRHYDAGMEVHMHNHFFSMAAERFITWPLNPQDVHTGQDGVFFTKTVVNQVLDRALLAHNNTFQMISRLEERIKQDLISYSYRGDMSGSATKYTYGEYSRFKEYLDNILEDSSLDLSELLKLDHVTGDVIDLHWWQISVKLYEKLKSDHLIDCDDAAINSCLDCLFHIDTDDNEFASRLSTEHPMLYRLFAAQESLSHALSCFHSWSLEKRQMLIQAYLTQSLAMPAHAVYQMLVNCSPDTLTKFSLENIVCFMRNIKTVIHRALQAKEIANSTLQYALQNQPLAVPFIFDELPELFVPPNLLQYIIGDKQFLRGALYNAIASIPSAKIQRYLLDPIRIASYDIPADALCYISSLPAHHPLIYYFLEKVPVSQVIQITYLCLINVEEFAIIAHRLLSDANPLTSDIKRLLEIGRRQPGYDNIIKRIMNNHIYDPATKQILSQAYLAQALTRSVRETPVVLNSCSLDICSNSFILDVATIVLLMLNIRRFLDSGRSDNRLYVAEMSNSILQYAVAHQPLAVSKIFSALPELFVPSNLIHYIIGDQQCLSVRLLDAISNLTEQEQSNILTTGLLERVPVVRRLSILRKYIQDRQHQPVTASIIINFVNYESISVNYISQLDFIQSTSAKAYTHIMKAMIIKHGDYSIISAATTDVVSKWMQSENSAKLATPLGVVA